MNREANRLFLEHPALETRTQTEPTREIHILMRNAVPEIPPSLNGAFAIYQYPAKFIPQVVAFALKKYAQPGMTIFDPFAGYGTAGVVSRLYGMEYILWDLNPMLEVIHNTVLLSPTLPFGMKPRQLLSALRESKKEYVPTWSNLDHWFPGEFLPILSRTWGAVHDLPKELKYYLLIPLAKTTRYFSYGDEKVHKLYSSKRARSKVERLLQGDWKKLFYLRLEEELSSLLGKLTEYNRLNPMQVGHTVCAGIDTLETNLDKDVDILITSPPYLQAQECIRSTK